MTQMHDHTFVDGIVAHANQIAATDGRGVVFTDDDANIGGYASISVVLPDGHDVMIRVQARSLSRIILAGSLREWIDRIMDVDTARMIGSPGGPQSA